MLVAAGGYNAEQIKKLIHAKRPDLYVSILMDLGAVKMIANGEAQYYFGDGPSAQVIVGNNLNEDTYAIVQDKDTFKTAFNEKKRAFCVPTEAIEEIIEEFLKLVK